MSIPVFMMNNFTLVQGATKDCFSNHPVFVPTVKFFVRPRGRNHGRNFYLPASLGRHLLRGDIVNVTVDG